MESIRILLYLFVIVSCLVVSSKTVERSFCYAIKKKKFGTPYIKFKHGFINEEQQNYYFSICEEQNLEGRSLSLKQYGNEDVTEDPLAECVLTSKPPDPATQCCGVDNYQPYYIFGGEEADITQYPWLVAIDYRDTKNNTKSCLCGGSLISGRYVVTAGHCVVGSIIEKATPFQVRLGDYSLQTMGPECSKLKPELCTDGEAIISIEKIILHPKHYHDDTTNIHDIALIRLNETANYTKFIRPICLPTTDVPADINPADPLLFYAVGWGAYNQTPQKGVDWWPIDQFSDMKRHVELPVRNIKECREIYGGFIDKGHICAGEHGRDTCRGDSGGPLVYNNKELGVYELAGVVSFGRKWCARAGDPAVYTNVYQYLDWIAEHIKN